ncbi:MAG: SDR family oxidoreductase [Gammaproteobacteria bacterium]|nr:SDR family oxidoreductase [Gammaproteobacteria bacterium]
MAPLDGRTAVVTGGGQGIGRACAEALAADGARVAVLDRNAATAQAAAATLPGAGRHLAIACDVSDSAQVEAAFAEVATACGRLDVLVNNAGIGAAPDDGSTEMYALMAQRNDELKRGVKPTVHVEQTVHMQDAGWRAIMAVNLDGAFYCTRAALRLMEKHGCRGSIINIVSTAVQSGEGPIHYVVSKTALVGLTRAIAREVASRGIRVNAVAPGPTDTPLMQGIPAEWIASLEQAVPLGRLARPAEVAAAVRFLAGDESSYVTGSILTVNGGSYFL